MAQNPFCMLCNCASHEDMPKDLTRNWACPLLGGKNICRVDCEYELEGGMGAPDTLAKVMRMTGKTAQEVRDTCLSCLHGKGLKKAPVIVSIVGKDGKHHMCGPELEEARKRSLREWKARIKAIQEGRWPPNSSVS